LLGDRRIEQHSKLQLHRYREKEVTGVRDQRPCITTGEQSGLINQHLARPAISLIQKKESEAMKNPFSPKSTVSIIALAMITLVTFSNFARAEGPSKRAERRSHIGERVRADIMNPQSSGKNDQVQYSQDDLEQMRSALLELAGAIKDLTELTPGSFDAGQLEDATKQVSQLSYQELAGLRKALNPSKLSAKLAGARAEIAHYKSTKSQSTMQKLKSKRVAITAADDDDFPKAKGLGICNGETDIRPAVGLIIAGDAAYFATKLVYEIAKDLCLETVVAGGEGGNTSALCIVSSTAFVAAEAAWNLIHFCNDEFSDDELDTNYERLGDIHTDLLESIANDNENKKAIVDNDNANKDTIIADIDAKSSSISSKIDGGTTNILNKIESKGNDIINNDNTNRDQIKSNDNANTNNIIANDNANKAMIISNENANLNTTINELRALGCDVIRLLNTPDGQKSSNIASCQGKPGWPYSFNTKSTSAPVAAASFITSDATGSFSNVAIGSFSNLRGQDGVPILPLVGTVTMERSLLESRLIPTYYLPANKGGMIEQVKTLVWNTIEAQLDLNIARNETTLAKVTALEADELLAKKKYLEAYRQYCLAYQQLIPAN